MTSVEAAVMGWVAEVLVAKDWLDFMGWCDTAVFFCFPVELCFFTVQGIAAGPICSGCLSGTVYQALFIRLAATASQTSCRLCQVLSTCSMVMQAGLEQLVQPAHPPDLCR